MSKHYLRIEDQDDGALSFAINYPDRSSATTAKEKFLSEISYDADFVKVRLGHLDAPNTLGEAISFYTAQKPATL